MRLEDGRLLADIDDVMPTQRIRALHTSGQKNGCAHGKGKIDRNFSNIVLKSVDNGRKSPTSPPDR